MGHPYSEHRAHKVEKERVHHLCRGGYAKGGAVHGDEAEDKKLIRAEVKKEALKGEGKKAKHRADRPGRAKGGRVKKGHGKTNVNVIVAPSGGAKPSPMAGLGPMAAPPPAPVAPPAMAAKPPMPMPPPGAGAPPMPMRKRGGKVSSADHRGKTGIGTRTPIQHTDNKDDTQNIGRKKPITYAKGGKVDPIKRGGEEQYSKASHVEAEGEGGAKGRKQYTDGWNEHTHPTTSRQHKATGGPI